MISDHISTKLFLISSCDKNSFIFSEQIKSFSDGNMKSLICSLKMKEFLSLEEIDPLKLGKSRLKTDHFLIGEGEALMKDKHDSED